ncbi:MAG: hypothetical protein LBJ12_02490 [Oscillospiraceae bacterium]|jgi:hypothetical protein|nr:hypothetical protein [Oscillospiraceae bacterium]
MKTKRILAILLAVLMLFGSGAAFNASAEVDVDEKITVHTPESKAPNGEFIQPGYFFVWVTGVYPGNVVKWIVKDSAGQELPTSVNSGSANFAGFTVGLGLPAGTYQITVEVQQGNGTSVNSNTPNVCTFIVPDRKKLRDALNNDDTLNFAFLYDSKKWKIYDTAKKAAIKAYETYYLTQDKLDAYAEEYLAAQADLPLKDQGLSDFLWHLLNLIFTLFNIIPFGNKPYYTL